MNVWPKFDSALQATFLACFAVFVMQLLFLESLYLHCVPLTTFTFTQDNTPKLRTITVDQGGTMRNFDLDLPDLESINFEHTQVSDWQPGAGVLDRRGFGPTDRQNTFTPDQR